MKVHSENNEENKEPGPAESVDQGAEPNSQDLGKEPKAKISKTTPRLVERATALRGHSIARPKEPTSTTRRQTQLDIYGKDSEIPYVKFEKAARDLVCSLMERQDRMNEEIFLKINDLEYRVDDIGEDRSEETGLK
jgi:hypothetical protein